MLNMFRRLVGPAYLAVLKAIDEYLLNKGLNKRELPKSVEGYRNSLQKYLAFHDGKLLRESEDICDELHIVGYYRGMLHSVDVVKSALRGKTLRRDHNYDKHRI